MPTSWSRPGSSRPTPTPTSASAWRRWPAGWRSGRPTRSRAAHEARRDADAQELLLHKNYDALGAWDGNDRVTVLDRLGFNSQLIFTSLYLNALTTLDRGDDEELSLGATRAHNRAIIDFCSADPRLLSTCWVPLASIERAIEIGRGARRRRRRADAPVVLPPPPQPDPRRLRTAVGDGRGGRLPIVFHVGGGGR